MEILFGTIFFLIVVAVVIFVLAGKSNGQSNREIVSKKDTKITPTSTNPRKPSRRPVNQARSTRRDDSYRRDDTYHDSALDDAAGLVAGAIIVDAMLDAEDANATPVQEVVQPAPEATVEEVQPEATEFEDLTKDESPISGGDGGWFSSDDSDSNDGWGGDDSWDD